MKILKRIADQKGYKDEIELLRDYGFVPSVLMAKYKKIEFIPMIWKHFKKKFSIKRSR